MFHLETHLPMLAHAFANVPYERDFVPYGNDYRGADTTKTKGWTDLLNCRGDFILSAGATRSPLFLLAAGITRFDRKLCTLKPVEQVAALMLSVANNPRSVRLAEYASEKLLEIVPSMTRLRDCHGVTEAAFELSHRARAKQLIRRASDMRAATSLIAIGGTPCFSHAEAVCHVIEKLPLASIAHVLNLSKIRKGQKVDANCG